MQILHTDRIGYEEAAKRAAIVLGAGGIVLYPTDTVYGLAVDAGNSAALSRLAELKLRAAAKTPLIAVPDVAALERYGRMNDAARDLATRFLPGPLTIIVPALPDTPAGVVRDDGTVGLRIPADPFCQALGAAFGRAYTSTSANLSGEPTEATLEEIQEQLGEAAGLITLAIDDGPREGNTPSTIVSCVTDTAVIVREGAVSRASLGL